ncbi:hypothetical protein RQP53_07675 [Paucibacter sp. APW11]|uniref:LysM domain-containing protein n=1 Tax=Roseateles aquae TaxID=3077235 RepID=A0ABU3P995_9BURK|nr:hypothetical protein [Paucibacter sp. APW11]MDT8999144.1 hypothetical protein [Paucibacter sp. APW11]
MSLFDAKSRYAKLGKITRIDHRGRAVEVVPPAPALQQALLGRHVRRQGERADHLAALYLSDPAGYWRLAEMNDAMTADVLAELGEVLIPTRA